MSEELKPCPFCGGDAVWCGSIPDDEGDYHDCEQITCISCEFNFVCNTDKNRHAETIELARIETAKAWNTRTK